VQAKVYEGNPEKDVELRGIEFVKQVSFKPGVKERRRYGWTEWRNRGEWSDRWRNRWVGSGGTSTRMILTKR